MVVFFAELSLEVGLLLLKLLFLTDQDQIIYNLHLDTSILMQFRHVRSFDFGRAVPTRQDL